MEAATLPGRMTLTTLEVEGVSVPVEVTPGGKFIARFEDEEYDATMLLELKAQVKEAILARRVEVPFVSESGRRGVMRGYHAGNRDILVTWDDGEKDRIRQYGQVFRPTDISDEAIAEILRLQEQREDIERRLRDLRRNTSKAEEMLSEALGFDVHDRISRRLDEDDTQN